MIHIWSNSSWQYYQQPDADNRHGTRRGVGCDIEPAKRGEWYGPALDIHHSRHFVTAKVTGRDGKIKFINLHQNDDSTRYVGYIVKQKCNGKTEAWGANEKVVTIRGSAAMGQSSSPSASAAHSRAPCSSATIPPWHENKPPDKGGSQGDIPKGDGEPHEKNQSAETESDAEKQWRPGKGKHHAPGGKYAEETGETTLGGLFTHVRSPCMPIKAAAKEVEMEQESESKEIV